MAAGLSHTTLHTCIEEIFGHIFVEWRKFERSPFVLHSTNIAYFFPTMLFADDAAETPAQSGGADKKTAFKHSHEKISFCHTTHAHQRPA